jgi:hypothetical protein
MTHIHAYDPDNPCPVDNDDTPEEAGRMEDGCSTEAAFDVYTAWREAQASGRYPQGKHWNGPEMKYHVTEADKEAARARESAAWAARAATGEFVCTLGHRHYKNADGSWDYLGPLGQTRDHPAPRV